MDVAGKESLNVGLVAQLMLEVEGRGDVCRDDIASAVGTAGATGVDIKWWPNAFVGYEWDGEED